MLTISLHNSHYTVYDQEETPFDPLEFHKQLGSSQSPFTNQHTQINDNILNSNDKRNATNRQETIELDDSPANLNRVKQLHSVKKAGNKNSNERNGKQHGGYGMPDSDNEDSFSNSEDMADDVLPNSAQTVQGGSNEFVQGYGTRESPILLDMLKQLEIGTSASKRQSMVNNNASYSSKQYKKNDLLDRRNNGLKKVINQIIYDDTGDSDDSQNDENTLIIKSRLIKQEFNNNNSIRSSPASFIQTIEKQNIADQNKLAQTMKRIQKPIEKQNQMFLNIWEKNDQEYVSKCLETNKKLKKMEKERVKQNGELNSEMKQKYEKQKAEERRIANEKREKLDREKKLKDKKERELKEEQKRQAEKEKERARVIAERKEKESQIYPNYKQLLSEYNKRVKEFDRIKKIINDFENDSTNEARIDNLRKRVKAACISLSATQRSIQNAFKFFSKIMNDVQSNEKEKLFCFYVLSKKILDDQRLERPEPNKMIFSTSYFLMALFNNFGEFRYFFENMFIGEYGNDWLLPYINGQMKHCKQEYTVDRCKLLNYKQLSKEEYDGLTSERRENILIFKVSGDKGNTANTANKLYFDESQWFESQGSRIALMMALISLNQSKEHLSINSGFGWIWLMTLLNLPKCVYPEIVHLLTKFLYYCGFEMQNRYPQQFPKIVQLIEDILNKCDSQSAKSSLRAASHRKLKSMIDEYYNNNRQFVKPKADIVLSVPEAHVTE